MLCSTGGGRQAARLEAVSGFAGRLQLACKASAFNHNYSLPARPRPAPNVRAPNTPARLAPPTEEEGAWEKGVLLCSTGWWRQAGGGTREGGLSSASRLQLYLQGVRFQVQLQPAGKAKTNNPHTRLRAPPPPFVAAACKPKEEEERERDKRALLCCAARVAAGGGWGGRLGAFFCWRAEVAHTRPVWRLHQPASKANTQPAKKREQRGKSRKHRRHTTTKNFFHSEIKYTTAAPLNLNVCLNK